MARTSTAARRYAPSAGSPTLPGEHGMNGFSIADVRWHALRVSHKTCWSFVELVDRDGRVGVGEATLAGREGEMQQTLERVRNAVTAHAPGDVHLEPARA